MLLAVRLLGRERLFQLTPEADLDNNPYKKPVLIKNIDINFIYRYHTLQVTIFERKPPYLSVNRSQST